MVLHVHTEYGAGGVRGFELPAGDVQANVPPLAGQQSINLTTCQVSHFLQFESIHSALGISLAHTPSWHL